MVNNIIYLYKIHNMSKTICFEKVVIPEGNSFLVRCDRDATIDNLSLHCHPEMEFQFTLKGSGMRTIGDVTEPFREMELVLIPGNIAHNWTYDSLSRGHIMEYNIQFLLGDISSKLSVFPEFRQISDMLSGLDSAMEIKGEYGVRISSLMMRMTAQSAQERLVSFMEILRLVYVCDDFRRIRLDMSDFRRSGTSRIAGILSYIEEHLCEDISLSDVAYKFSMSRTAFCNYFRRCTGRTLVFTVNEMRINRACMMLTNDDSLCIADVAYRCGFNNTSHFCHVFKRLRGCSPGEYKQRGIVLADRALSEKNKY